MGCGARTVFSRFERGSTMLGERDAEGEYTIVDRGGRTFWDHFNPEEHGRAERYTEHRCVMGDLFKR
jgi:hypothetical protein